MLNYLQAEDTKKGLKRRQTSKTIRRRNLLSFVFTVFHLGFSIVRIICCSWSRELHRERWEPSFSDDVIYFPKKGAWTLINKLSKKVSVHTPPFLKLCLIVEATLQSYHSVQEQYAAVICFMFISAQKRISHVFLWLHEAKRKSYLLSSWFKHVVIVVLRVELSVNIK